MSHATVWSPVPESLHQGSRTNTHSFKVVQPCCAASLPAQLVWIPVLQVEMKGSACLHVAQQLCRWGFLPQLHHVLAQFQAAYTAQTSGQEHGALLCCATSCGTALQDLEEVRACLTLGSAGLVKSASDGLRESLPVGLRTSV